MKIYSKVSLVKELLEPSIKVLARIENRIHRPRSALAETDCADVLDFDFFIESDYDLGLISLRRMRTKSKEKIIKKDVVHDASGTMGWGLLLSANGANGSEDNELSCIN